MKSPNSYYHRRDISNPTVPYTYYIRNRVTGQRYYGVRYAKGCHPTELWQSYFTSSKAVWGLMEAQGKASFDVEVRRVFTSSTEARTWEEKVLRRLGVLQNDLWLNKNVCGKFLTEGPQTPEHVRKRVASSLVTRAKNGWLTYERTPEQRAAISKRLKGVKKSVEHVAHMKCHDNNKAIVTCPTCGKTGQYVNMKRWHFENCGKERKLYTCPHCGANKALPGVMRYHFDNCKQRSD